MRHPWILCVYAAAMGILEAAVVVYLRRIYYPAGFGFPLAPLEPSIGRVEVIREAMTIVMLACAALLAAEAAWSRLVAFLVAFGVWDILYYVGLKLFLDWPAGLLTPDVLFLIPRPWVGPVLAPVLVSLWWVVGGLLVHRAPYAALRMGLAEWGGIVLSVALILVSFLARAGAAERPSFHWWIFGAGFAVGAGVSVLLVRRGRAGTGPVRPREASRGGSR